MNYGNIPHPMRTVTALVGLCGLGGPWGFAGSAEDELHWKVAVRLKAGGMATVFSNAGSQDVGESDFYLADVHPGASWLIFRRRSYPEGRDDTSSFAGISCFGTCMP